MANQRRRRMQLPTILSRDLLNLALVLAFLHLDPDAYLGISRNENHQSLLNYQNIQPNMYSNKILDDLSALGHFTNPVAANQFNFDQPFEISAYILNAETTFQDTSAVNIHNNQSQSFSTNEHNSNETNDEGTEQNNIIDDGGQGAPNAVINDNNDIDSGVSDVDSGHQSSGEDFEDNLSSFQPSESSASPAQLGELDDAQDWILRSEIKIEETEVPPLHPLLNNFDVLFDVDESSNIFRDLDDIIGTPNAIPDTTQAELNDIEFAPDEEDVENQLMHIDDQLIRLDENIEDITDHLDEQLLNTATVENDALLSAEEENLLFSSMPEVMDLDQNWQLADPRDQEIEELIAAGLPSPLMPSPFMVAVDDEPKEYTGENPVLIKQEIKEEPIEGPEESQLYYGDEHHDLDWLEPYMSPVMSPSDSLASSNLPADLLGSEEEEEVTASHLLDHNYAMSPYDECFGASQNGLAASSLSQKTSHSSATNIDFEGGASSQFSASSSGAGLTASQRLSRDERKAKKLGLPFLVADIIDLPIDAFNELLTRHTMTEDQLMLCRDIRRRGKNKVAAQNCRKRKMDLISELEEQVISARSRKESLLAEREELYRLRDEWTHKLLNLETDVLRGLNRKVNDYSFDYSGASAVVTRLVKSKA